MGGTASEGGVKEKERREDDYVIRRQRRAGSWAGWGAYIVPSSPIAPLGQHGCAADHRHGPGCR